jgi:DNA helicase II / ATP-dependent DNA helicase PcrA
VRFIADLHIHSHYSMATSKLLNPEYLDYWARLKGIGLVATGDFTHYKWIAELKEKLEPAEDGLFRLRPELRIKLPFANSRIENSEVRFILSSEISNIYKKNGKVRKVHNLIYAPSFEVVEKIQARLSKIGNITSDGRPILGLDSRNLLELALECSPDIFFVPAHIWTPWFSILGEKGGFNSVEECFGDLSHHIYALETGLSTNPALNWMCSSLDKYTLLSNSDAHSPERLGRNANVLDCNFSYQDVIEALKNGNGNTFLGTIDFYPQEGKYHYDGHRKCNVCWNPVETLKHRAICPLCGKHVVVGVASRIAQLSDRADITQRPNRRDFYSIIPLPEILSEITGTGESSKKVRQFYFDLLEKCGSEFDILLNHPLVHIYNNAGPLVAEAVKRMRNGEVIIKEGFDGEYGVIKVFKTGECKQFEADESMFLNTAENRKKKEQKLLNFDLAEYRRLVEEHYTLEDTESVNKNNKEPDSQLKLF